MVISFSKSKADWISPISFSFTVSSVNWEPDFQRGGSPSSRAKTLARNEAGAANFGLFLAELKCRVISYTHTHAPRARAHTHTHLNTTQHNTIQHTQYNTHTNTHARIHIHTCVRVYVYVSDAKSFGKRDCVVARGRGKVPRGKRDGTRGEEEIGWDSSLVKDSGRESPASEHKMRRRHRILTEAKPSARRRDGHSNHDDA